MITAIIVGKPKREDSKWGGYFYRVCFKDIIPDENSKLKSYTTNVFPKCRNYARWKKIIDMGERAIGLELTNLSLWRNSKNIIDADSKYVINKKENVA